MSIAIPKLKITEVIEEIEHIYAKLVYTGVIDVCAERVDELISIAQKSQTAESQPMTFYSLALLYTLKDDKLNACFYHKKLIKLQPHNPDHLYNYSVLLWVLGDVKQAINCLNQVAKLPLHLEMKIRLLCNFTKYLQFSEAAEMLKRIAEQHTQEEIETYLPILGENKRLSDKCREIGLDEKKLTELLSQVCAHFHHIFPLGVGIKQYYDEHSEMMVYEIIGNSTQDEAFEIDLQLVDFISKFEVEHNINFSRFLLMYKGAKQ